MASEHSGAGKVYPPWRRGNLLPLPSRMMKVEVPSVAPQLPLVGRAAELGLLRTSLERAAAGRGGGTLVIEGPEGAGKSRLVDALTDEARRRGFLASVGRAYPMESGVPYAIFCDLLDPLLQDESPESLVAHTRGAPEFQLVCPTLAVDGPRVGEADGGDIPDIRSRLHWNFPGFLDRLRRDRPLLLVLEDLERADPSSLELFHFLGRQAPKHPLVLVGTFGGDPGGRGEEKTVHELVAGSGASLIELGALAPEDVLDAVCRGFGADAAVVAGFAGALHRWTGGNPLFVTSTLDALVGAGRLYESGGRWVGWHLDQLTPPGSVRALVLQRLAGLSGDARAVADLAAVVGRRATYRLMREAGTLEESALLKALDTLVSEGILDEVAEGKDVFYSFRHPLVREILYAEIGIARARLLHSRIARSMETLHGEAAMDHAEEMAYHIIFAKGEVDAERGAAYLEAAGRQALRAHADREAVRFLGGALELLEDEPDGGSSEARMPLLLALARAHQRLGGYRAAADLLHQARALAHEAGSSSDVAGVDRRLGLVAYWAGDIEEAMQHCERGLEGTRAAADPVLEGAHTAADPELEGTHTPEDPVLEARLRLLKSACLQTLARPEEAGREAREALRLGEVAGDLAIRGAAHRQLILLHTWTGPPAEARSHGEAATALAEEMEDERARFSAHWALAVLEGLTGNAEGVRRHLEVARRTARDLDSPLLRLQIAEVEIEFAAELGEWDRGLDLAEESLRMARELNQRHALPRLLVSSGLLHLKRGEVETARREIDEAWQLAAEGPESGPAANHLTILAHSGRAALQMATGEFEEAAGTADRGLALVDRCGYGAWGIHRLLPILAEACVHLGDLDRAEGASRRLRADSKRFEHRLGLLWADTCDAIIAWRRGDVRGGAAQMARAVERLEEALSVPDAARLRRQLAGRLADLGERDAAIRELRTVHDTLAALGAEPELSKAREQFREVGARPPTRASAPGIGELTAREVEIAHLVAERRTNKAIGRALGISPRTVGTHLTNIFHKLEIDSRTVLGDRVRSGLLDGDP